MKKKKIDAVTYLVPFTTFIIVVFHFCTNVHSACGSYVFELIVEIFASVREGCEKDALDDRLILVEDRFSKGKPS